MSEAERFFFDLGSINYWDEEYSKALKESWEKQKFEREHNMNAPMDFSAHQELLRLARENTEASSSEDEAED